MQESGVKNEDGADGWWHCRVQFSESRVDFQIRKPAQKYPENLVLGSPVPRLQKDWDWTRPRPPRTRNSQDCQRPQLQSSLQSFRILEISRLTGDWSNQSQPVFAVWKVTQICTVVYKYLCNISTSAFMKSTEIIIGSGVWMWSTMSVMLSSPLIKFVFSAPTLTTSLSTQQTCQICIKKVCGQF